MDINATFIGQIIVFLILLWFINRVVVPMLAKPIAARQKKIAEGLAAADRGQKDLDEAQARANDVIREARERANQIVDQASRRSTEMVESAKQTASVEVERLLATGRQQIELDAARAREELRRDVARLSVATASKLIGREIDAAKHADILNQLATEI
ncbi:MAG: F0F1 ATP synthase subunit B [Proteobacteria bacterium]|jgi:F-type H+-transporting ATPase subunit b|nr:F0F1 ATP synthase subunit B [Pseudomonadota bacterium]